MQNAGVIGSPPPLPPGPPAVLGQPPGRTKLSLVLYLAPVKLLSYYVKCCFFATSIHSLKLPVACLTDFITLILNKLSAVLFFPLAGRE